MRKATKRKVRVKRLTPVEAAVASARWDSYLNSAAIHALIGQDLAAVRDRVATLLLIIGLSAKADKLSGPEVDVLHDACHALMSESLDEDIRTRLNNGLMAAVELKKQVSDVSIVTASVHVANLIRSGGVDWSEFEKFLGEEKCFTV